MISEEKAVELGKIANRIRCRIVGMVGCGKTGHIGGSCSIAEIISVLYFHKMRHEPSNPSWEDRDRFLLSKGHSALAQYAALAECGYFPQEELAAVKKLGSLLQGHPDMRKTPGIEANTGSLGQGLSIACGIAAGAKLDKKTYRVYCITGDGEIAEGQIWEAAMAAVAFKLDNLTVILDHNRLQATGFIADRFDTGPLEEKWKAFGWDVYNVDGHDVRQIAEILDVSEKSTGRPVIIIAETIKGKGISFAENNPAFHNGAFTAEQYEMAYRVLAEGAGGRL